MASRLDKLMLLMETGSAVARGEAAQHLAAIQRDHPDQLIALLNRLVQLIVSGDWDTRLAVSNALLLVLQQVPQYKDDSDWPTGVLPHSSLADFSLDYNLASGRLLLASGAEEFRRKNQATSLDDPSNARAKIDSQLGLKPQFGISSKDWGVSDQDLVPASPFSSGESDTRGSVDDNFPVQEPVFKQVKLENSEETPTEAQSSELMAVLEIMSRLLKYLGDDAWTIRHGAALGLKSMVLALSSRSCSKDHAGSGRRRWLETVCCRVLSVMAHDRFNDFVGSNVVAPVRETGAQVMGAVFALTAQDEAWTRSFLQVVFKFGSDALPWDIRLCCLLMLKYIMLAAMKESPSAFSYFAEPIRALLLSCLCAENDDISSLAAQIILSGYARLKESVWESAVLEISWNALITNSESSATFLELIADYDRKSTVETPALIERLQLLLPYLEHSLSSVRSAAIKCSSQLLHCNLKTALGVAEFQDFWSAFLKIIFQRFLLETVDEIRQLLQDLWNYFFSAVCAESKQIFELTSQYFGIWLSFLMLPDSNPKLETKFLHTSHIPGSFSSFYIGSEETLSLEGSARKEFVANIKIKAADLLAVLCPHYLKLTEKLCPEVETAETPCEALNQLFLMHLWNVGNSVNQKIAVSLVVSRYAEIASRTSQPCAIWDTVVEKMTADLCNSLTALSTVEVACRLSELRECANSYASLLRDSYPNISLPAWLDDSGSSLWSCEQVQELVAAALPEGKIKVKSNLKMLREKREYLGSLVEQVSEFVTASQQRLDVWLCSALINLNRLPDKLNPILKPLTACIKAWSSRSLLREACSCLARLMKLVSQRSPSPNAKLITNLIAFLAADSWKTPSFEAYAEQSAEMISYIRIEGAKTDSGPNGNGKVNVAMANISEGAQTALIEIVKIFGADLSKLLPSLASSLSSSLADVAGKALIHRLRTLACVFPHLPADFQEQLCQAHLASLKTLLISDNPAVRFMVCQCLVQISATFLIPVINEFLLHCCEHATDTKDVVRLGIAEFFYSLVQTRAAELVGVITLFILPLLGMMSDALASVRSVSAIAFAALIRLVPLESRDSIPKTLSDSLKQRHAEQFGFLEKLTSMGAGSAHEPLDLPFELGVTLRTYQLEGIHWLKFLNSYGLHGILCDDMGLGKTVQTLVALAESHARNKPNYPSIVVCPSSVMLHWMKEIEEKFDAKVLQAFLCDRRVVKSIANCQDNPFTGYQIVITSYDCLRRAVNFFTAQQWHYCVLDEGHVIKNPKTQLFKALIRLKARHRLILSGTPIQNSVLELWSLFEFLMPGYLDKLSVFNAVYGKPILLRKEAKVTAAEAEAGQRALDALHKQVLPFILRRLKSDVLKELPPKIIQDHICELSPLQSQLYEDFVNNLAQVNPQELTKRGNSFQMLSYLRKLCDHPALVVPEGMERFRSSTVGLEDSESGDSLYSLTASGKLLALQQILSECGIGSDAQPVVSSHRALIFCQFKGMLDIVEHFFATDAMGRPSYLRIDGGVAPALRQGIVDRFNADPSVDVLLLTTQVGSLGLNLTGADVVVFIDHDWNPTRDLQAMDRAHRLGQTKSVNVYRIITRGTLEEKIMRLQLFKTHVAESVVTKDNRSLVSMATDQLLDLMTLDKPAQAVPKSSSEKPSVTCETGKNLLPGKVESELPLDDLWSSTDQYDQAFDVDTFIKSLEK